LVEGLSVYNYTKKICMQFENHVVVLLTLIQNMFTRWIQVFQLCVKLSSFLSNLAHWSLQLLMNHQFTFFVKHLIEQLTSRTGQQQITQLKVNFFIPLWLGSLFTISEDLIQNLMLPSLHFNWKSDHWLFLNLF